MRCRELKRWRILFLFGYSCQKCLLFGQLIGGLVSTKLCPSFYLFLHLRFVCTSSSLCYSRERKKIEMKPEERRGEWPTVQCVLNDNRMPFRFPFSSTARHSCLPFMSFPSMSKKRSLGSHRSSLATSLTPRGLMLFGYVEILWGEKWEWRSSKGLKTQTLEYLKRLEANDVSRPESISIPASKKIKNKIGNDPRGFSRA